MIPGAVSSNSQSYYIATKATCTIKLTGSIYMFKLKPKLVGLIVSVEYRLLVSITGGNLDFLFQFAQNIVECLWALGVCK